MGDINNPVNTDFVASNYQQINQGSLDSNDNVSNGSYFGQGAVAWATKGVPLAVASGVSQLWNGVGYLGNKIGNIGSDDPTPYTPTMDVGQLANNYDDTGTYGQYYQAHQAGIDLGGFIAGSVVPSGLAVKGLQMVQRGAAITDAVGSATGLLNNTAERYWLNAAASNLGADTTSLLPRVGASLSFGSQMGLEGIAASTATYATMSQSPEYADIQDAGDAAKSILTGGLLFGALGAGYRAVAFKRALFPLAGAEASVASDLGPMLPTQVYTSLNDLEKVSGSSIFDASYSPTIANMTGKTITGQDEAAYYARKQIDEARGTPQVVDDFGNVVNPQPLNSYTFTAGDQLAATITKRMDYEASLADNPNPLTPNFGGNFADALNARTAQVQANKLAEVTAAESDIYTALAKAGAAPDVAAPFKNTIDAFVSNGDSGSVNQILSGLKSIGRVSEDTNSNVDSHVINLATGEMEPKVIPTAGDLGKVKAINQDSISIGDKKVSLTPAQSQQGMIDSPAHIAQARYYAEMEYLKSNPKITTTDLSQYKVPSWDIPKMEASIRTFGKFLGEDGVLHDVSTGDALQVLQQAKNDFAEAYAKANPEFIQSDLRTRMNVTSNYLNMPLSKVTAQDLMNGIDTTALNHAELTYLTANRVPNIWEIKAIAGNELKLKAYQQFNEQLLPGIIGDTAGMLPDINLANYDGVDTFAGRITTANAAYGSEASKIQYAGTLAQRKMLEFATTREARFMSIHNKLGQFGSGSKEATELAIARYKVQSAGAEGKLALGTDGNIYKVKDLMAVEAKTMDTKDLVPEMKISSPEVLEYLNTHATYEGELLAKKNIVNKITGKGTINRYSSSLGQELYFSPPHPADLKYKVMVYDESNGNMGMLWGKDKADLQTKIAQVSQANPQWSIRTPEQLASYFKLNGIYEDALDLRGYTKVDQELRKMGIMVDAAPTTNMNDILANNMRDFSRTERSLLTSSLNVKYGDTLAESYQAARALGQDNIGLKKIYNTIMNITDKNNAWSEFSNRMEDVIDQWGARPLLMLRDSFASVKAGKMSFSQVEAKAFADANGVNLFNSPALWNQSKASSFTGATQTAIRNINSAMRFFVLGIDMFNGLVNMIGTPIMALPEIRAAYANGVDVPWAKILGNGMKDLFYGEGRRADLQKYVDMKLMNNNMFLYHDMVDEHALMYGAENSSDAMALANSTKSKMEKFLNTLQTPTAYAEQCTQLFACKIADTIGQARGLTGNDLAAFISTMQKKIIGNYTAAQRPLVFQGILGQAVGLFQTYNFNMYQQAARHLSEGNNKSIGAMLALQGTLFGAQSIPGFGVLNQAIGAYNGKSHDDIYTGVHNLLGEDVGNSLIYGGLSQMLGSNLWTRGDANPRSLTVIPVTPADLVQVQYYGKALNGIKEWTQSILNGGNMKVSALEAIAHANISKALTGIAELALGGRTTPNGNLDNAVGTDLLSTATAIRVMGGRPMAEAISQDMTYKFGLVKAQEQKNMASLADALKTQILDGNGSADAATLDEFAKKYVEFGGHPQGFRKWYLSNLAKATVPRAQLFAKANRNSSWAQAYQQLASPDSQAGYDYTPAY